MGGAGTECDSDRARTRQTTLQSLCVIGFERVRYQYVGHCSKHVSCTFVPISAYNITIPFLPDTVAAYSGFSRRRKAMNEERR